MSDSPSSARRQRKMLYTAHTALRRRMMSVPLSKELRSRFHRRALPPRKGDTVRILKGSYEGREERIAKVDRRALAVTLDNVTSKTGESKQTALPVRTGSLVLVHLNLADPWRRRRLKVTEADLSPEELGVKPEPEEATAAAPAALPAPVAQAPPPHDEPTLEDLLDGDEKDDDEEGENEGDRPQNEAPAPKTAPAEEAGKRIRTSPSSAGGKS